mgnify:FL=1
MINVSHATRMIRNGIDEELLTDKARQWLNVEDAERSPGFHTSDILEPRLAYWRIKHPLPLDEQKVWMFLIGRILHTFVLAAHDEIPFAGMDLRRMDIGVSLEGNGIHFTPDDILANGTPVELKTTRSFYPPKPEKYFSEYFDYLRQLLIYAANLNKTSAKLWILYLNTKNEGTTRPEPRCFDIEFTSEDLERARLVTQDTIHLIEQSLDDGTFRRLPLCTDWKCWRGEKPQCPYFEIQCQPEGRYEEWLLTPAGFDAGSTRE